MKKQLLLLTMMCLPYFAISQVWQESFNGLSNGSASDTGPTSWTTISPSGGAASFSKQTPVTGYEVFLINNTITEGIWESGSIDISAHEKVAIEITLYSNFTYSTDYMHCYYKVNGGAEVLFGELQGNNGLNITSAASAIVSGNTLQIIIRGSDNTTGSTSGILNGMAFDDVTITNITVLHSISSGNWSTNNTWSTEGFNGASCDCTPNANTQVVIGNNRNVSVPGAGTVAGITIENTGKLQFTGNTSLTMARGGTLTVDLGGEFSNNSGRGNIIYGAYTYSIIVNGVMSLTTFTAGSGSSLAFSGNGSVAVDNFLVGSGNGRTITLNTAGGFSISNDLNFQAASSNITFINQRTLTIGNRLLFASNTATLTNNATLNTGSIVVNASTNNGNILTNAATGTLNTGAINLNNGDLTLNNSGVINQTGNFSNIDNGSTLRNLNGSIWNFSGGGSNTRLFCNNGTNTFNYSAAGAQSILIPADAYSNLTLSTSGLKTLAGNLDVNGNLSIDNTAQLDVSTSLFSISLGGNWRNSGTVANPFVERTATVTFDGTTDQSISCGLGIETFYNLTINKAAGDAIQSSSIATDVIVTNTLTLTNGGLSINGRTLTINNSNNAAIARTGGCIISETTSAPYSYLRWSIGSATGAYVFPFGKTRLSADYIPFTFNVTNAGVGTGSVAVTTYPTPASNMPLPTGVTHLRNASMADNSANVVDRFWFITLSSYTTNPTTNVTFVATPSEVGSINTLRAQRWNSTLNGWDPPKGGQTSAAYSTTVPAVSTFSPWTMSGNNTPLPIDLLSFNAFLKNDEVNIEWQSAQELNNDYYTIQKTTDLETYHEVLRVNGAGTSTKKNSYHEIDKNLTTGKSYYRLQQTDYDGQVTYFKPVMIQYTGSTSAILTAYPVPSKAHELTIELKGLKPYEDFILEVTDLKGNIIFTKQNTADATGKFSEKLFLNKPIPTGIYLVKGGHSLKLIKKIVIE